MQLRLRALRDGISSWLNAIPIRQRLRHLFLLNVVGLSLLLALSILSSVIKDRYFTAIERLNTEQRQLRRFDTETARLQASIREYITMPNEDLILQIDKSTATLFADLEKIEQENDENAASFTAMRDGLRSFIEGYRELRSLNAEIDNIYQTELQDPSERAADLLALVMGETVQQHKQTLVGPASLSLINTFIESLLKINSFYVKRETKTSLSTRASLERVAALAPVLEEFAPGEIERSALRQLQSKVHTMISGLGSLQRASAKRNLVLDRKIEAGQQTIAQAARLLDQRYAAIELSLSSRYAHQLMVINVSTVLVGVLVVAITFLFSAMIARSIRSPLAQLMQSVEAFSNNNFEHPVPDLGKNELGQLAGSLTSFRESALERVRAENALRNSESRFRSLSDMSSDLLWEQDAEYRYISFTGNRADELLEKNVLRLGATRWESAWPHLRTPEQREKWQEHKRRVEAHEPFRNFEFSVPMPDGSILYLQSNGDPLYDTEGRFLGYSGTAKDITAQKASEQEILRLNQGLEQRVHERTAALERSNQQLSQAMDQLVHSEKLASLGSLVAGVAHELNTPLGNALIASTSLREHMAEFAKLTLSGQLKKSDFARMVETCVEGCSLIERNTHRAVSLVTNFKQVAVDQTSEQRRRFNLAKTIAEVVAAMGPAIRKAQHSITIDIPDDIELDSYPGPLDQVVSNLIINAMVHGYRPGESGDLHVSARLSAPGEVRLTIADNGIGIPKERQGRVFDPFFTTRMGEGGSGLGLYIVYNIVTTLLGGQIQLDSTPDEGTAFILYIPVEAPAQSLSEVPAESVSAAVMSAAAIDKASGRSS
ncbi:ATP-binding protein [Uliginosibacterium sp. H3]|uniref:histidine kinase n=1 Tax=Uliginosibacterium silvisoli TaxID=3114758 RepID=A0ABU6K276_9RHOO|nr:ATP-binding protein [Uliginosibacterium sp. H3]